MICLTFCEMLYYIMFDGRLEHLASPYNLLEARMLLDFCRKAVCDWLSSGIEDLKLAAEKDEYEYDIRKDKPSKVTRTADNLEFIQKKLKET